MESRGGQGSCVERNVGQEIERRKRDREREEERGERREESPSIVWGPRVEVPRTVLHVAPAIFDTYVSRVHITFSFGAGPCHPQPYTLRYLLLCSRHP